MIGASGIFPLQHFREKGWTDTTFQLYLNNKYYWRRPEQGGEGSSWWLLDEPFHRDDYLAIAFYGRLMEAGVRDAGDVRFQFRIDISRPEWQRGMLDGLTGLSCVSRAFFGKNRLLRRRLRDRGELIWNYGHANRLNASNLDMRAWAWTVWLMGGDGLLPWNTIGQNGSWRKLDPLAVLYPGAPVGIQGPVASTRLKALRRGQQDVELLALLAECEGWSRERVAEAVLSEMEIEAEQEEAFVDDAGQVTFSGVSVGAFSSVAKRVAKTIC